MRLKVFQERHNEPIQKATERIEAGLPEDAEVIFQEGIPKDYEFRYRRWIWVMNLLLIPGGLIMSVPSKLGRYWSNQTTEAAGVAASREISDEMDLPRYKTDLAWRDRVGSQGIFLTIFAGSATLLISVWMFSGQISKALTGFFIYSLLDYVLLLLLTSPPRERKMIDDITRICDRNGYDNAVLVAGSFHRDGLVEIAKRRGYRVDSDSSSPLAARLRRRIRNLIFT